MKQITKEWVKKAEEDYRVARWNMKAKRPVYNAVCFHVQQCIEKYLKALLQENEVVFPKVHNLVTLMKLCLPIWSELGSYKDEIKVLTAFSVEIRYPGTDATEADAKRSLRIAFQLRRLIRQRLEIIK